MKAVYPRLKNLLGQPPNGSIFSQFVADLGCDPVVEASRFAFPTTGVTIFAIDHFFSILLIHIDDESVRQGIISRYQGDLPSEIDLDDGPETIERKLGTPPMSSERLSLAGLQPRDFQNTYSQAPFVLTFDFATDTKKLSSITVSLA